MKPLSQNAILPTGFGTQDVLIGYARVSTLDRSPRMQTDALNRAGCGRIFTEQASGGRRHRPQLAAALDWAREGDTLVVWRLDRLSRSLRQLIETVEDLQDRGNGLRSLGEAIGAGGAGGRFVFHVFGALAEFERILIRERTMAGPEAARRRGRTAGRPGGLSYRDRAMARAMLADPGIRVGDVAARLGTSRATPYRHLPGGRDGTREGIRVTSGLREQAP